MRLTAPIVVTNTLTENCRKAPQNVRLIAKPPNVMAWPITGKSTATTLAVFKCHYYFGPDIVGEIYALHANYYYSDPVNRLLLWRSS